MYGADVDQLEALAKLVADSSTTLASINKGLSATLETAPWAGRKAEQFRAEWNRSHRPSLAIVADQLSSAAEALRRNASEQRDASGAAQSAPQVATITGPLECRLPPLGELVSRSTVAFESNGSGRADIVEALYATADTGRAKGDEIEIRQLTNGRYIVVLPGVVDLSSHRDGAPQRFINGTLVDPMFDGQQPNTVRRMAYAITEALDNEDTFVNPYATRVIEQMQRGGIPPGAEVMFIGHSFGAFTAMELAGNADFNSADGVSSGYHVNVTHVVAAGADTDWKMAELPDATKSLIFNNRKDLVYQGETPIQPNEAPRHSGQLEIEFFGKSDQQAVKGFGHSPDIYAQWLAQSDDRPNLNAWLNDAGAKYSSSGTAYSVQVLDQLPSKLPV